jgi:hypothetical protein
LRRKVVARVTTRARPAPTARRRASRPIHCRRVGLKRRASQNMTGVSAAQRYASNRVRRMGPDAGATGRSAARGSVRRLAVMRTARNVQNAMMTAISRARSPRIGPDSSGVALTMSLVPRLP